MNSFHIFLHLELGTRHTSDSIHNFQVQYDTEYLFLDRGRMEYKTKNCTLHAVIEY
jgi:hypothetical protein